MNRIMVFLLAALMLFSAQVFAQDSSPSAPTPTAELNATVIFYRSTQDGGKPYALTSQNTVLAKLKKGDKFEQKLEPGTYYYMADPESTQVFKMEIEAGKTYYVHASRDGSFFNGQPSLKLASVQEYQRAIANN
jgi:hypothetical protein